MECYSIVHEWDTWFYYDNFLSMNRELSIVMTIMHTYDVD